jgi:hypothetical protein
MRRWLRVFQVGLAFSRMKALLNSILFLWSVVFHNTFDPWNKTDWKTATLIKHMLSFFIICLNSYTRILDRLSLSYVFIPIMIISGIEYDMSRSTARTISSLKISTNGNITLQMFVYERATILPAQQYWTIIAWAYSLLGMSPINHPKTINFNYQALRDSSISMIHNTHIQY